MGEQGVGRRALALVVSAAAIFGVVEQAGAAAEPANGFNVSFEASGSFSRDGTYFDPGQQHGTVSTDGSYSTAAKTMFPVYLPTAGTDKQTTNFLTDPATATFDGTVSATETLTDEVDGSGDENSSCTGNYDATHQQQIFAFAYRGAAGNDIELLVAPSDFANVDVQTRTCSDPDRFALDQLFYQHQSTFDGAPSPVADYEWSKAVTVTQAQLNSNGFSVPISYGLSGSASWAVNQDAPDGRCDVSVYAGNGGQCTWQQSWSGTLKFERVCSAKDGGQVDFLNPTTGSDGVQRWFANGACFGAGGGDACVVPDVEGKKLKKAKRKIKKANCRVGKVTEERSDKVEKDHVIKQKPKPGKVKPAGAKVKLVVSSG